MRETERGRQSNSMSGRRVPGQCLSVSTKTSPRKNTQHTTYDDQPRSANLSLRLDPIESLSDWTLVVVSNENIDISSKDKPPTSGVTTTIDDGGDSVVSELSEKPKTDKSKDAIHKKAANLTPAKRYFVHKAVLGVGPRKGDFFSKIFHRQREALKNEENKRSNNGDLEPVTYIEVKPSAAAAFEVMLDFVYASNDTPVKATTESAVALRHLSIALGIRELFNSVTPFIQRDLSALTSPIYLFEADRYNHEKLFNVALKICAANFATIKLSSIIILTPRLFQRVLTSPHFKCDSNTLSSRVASYFRCRPNSINEENIIKFTPPEIMPTIVSNEVLFFLNLMGELGLLSQYEENIVSSKVFSLYERCIDASSEAICDVMEIKSLSCKQGKHRRRIKKKDITSDYETIPYHVKVDLLEKALLGKMKKNNAVVSSQIVENRDCEVTEKHRSRHTKKEKERYRRLKDDYQQRLASMEENLATKEQMIQRYASELSKFTRVSNKYRLPPLLSDHTYKREPTYDKYGGNVYGYIPPTALPRIGRPNSDGWIYKEERSTADGQTHEMLWPMYYYKAN